MSAARSAEWRQACGRVHARAKQLGLDDEARRDLQRRETGKESCAAMSVAELRQVLAAMNGRRASGARTQDRASDARTQGRAGAARTHGQARGGRDGGARSPARAGGAPGNRLPPGNAATRPLLAKLRALWISGWHLGVVRDRSDEALAVWLRRQTGLDAAAWAQPPALVAAVEALQAWLARDGGVDWSPYPERCANGRTRQAARPQARVIEAQWRLLHRLGVVEVGALAALGAYACRQAGIARADTHLALDQGETVKLMQHLGRRIRKAQGKPAPKPAA